MTYKIGTRVKYISYGDSRNEGLTGVVTRGNSFYGGNIFVRTDQDVIDDLGRIHLKGYVVESLSKFWTPIVPNGSIPSEFSFNEIMEDLKLNMMA